MSRPLERRLYRAAWSGGLLVLVAFALMGCSTEGWKRYSESPANPATWVRPLFPPKGEYFYSDKAHEIEKSLSRRQNVEMPQ